MKGLEQIRTDELALAKRRKKPRPGRPPLGRTTVRVNLKLSGTDHKRWVAAADRGGLSLSEWLRAAAERELTAPTRPARKEE